MLTANWLSVTPGSQARGARGSATPGRQGLSTCTVHITGGGDIMFREDISNSPVIQQQPVVRELPLSDRDGRERETASPRAQCRELGQRRVTQTQYHPLNTGKMSPSLLQTRDQSYNFLRD